jgi:hypothetical protein
MRKHFFRSITLVSLTALTMASAGSAATDLAAEKNKEQLIELNFLSSYNPFPKDMVIEPIDPITKKKTDGVSVGPAFRTRAYGSGYDYYRYLTFYNVSYRKERFYELPIQRAQCYETSSLFANYTSSRTYSATVSASASLEGLGITASMTESNTLSTGHGIAATGGIVADYIPYIMFHDWEGRTFVQLYNSKTGEIHLLDKERKQSSWWTFVLFPHLAQEAYPSPFEIIGADRTFMVDRKILETCEDVNQQITTDAPLNANESKRLTNRLSGS